MEFESEGLFTASATQTSAGTLILVSKALKNGFELVLVEHV
jgi:hypothetical protein